MHLAAQATNNLTNPLILPRSCHHLDYCLLIYNQLNSLPLDCFGSGALAYPDYPLLINLSALPDLQCRVALP